MNSNGPQPRKPRFAASRPALPALLTTGFNTSEPAAIIAPFPTVMLPSMVEWAPMRTPFPILGCRSPMAFPVPPSVTPCKMLTLFPTTAVSPMTTPVPWSMRMPLPN